jgi:predicted Zn finger-like uncharacterized protein
MFIKCQHCKATYKIDINKIPSEKSYVKCSNCSKPIPLDPNPVDHNTTDPEGHLVECDSCSSRYMIPIETIANKSLKVRCGKCSNLFTVPALNEVSTESNLKGASDFKSNLLRESANLDQEQSLNSDLDGLSQTDPEGPDSDDLFGEDDLVRSGNDTGFSSVKDIDADDDLDLNISGFSSKPPDDATAEYLKSVSYEDESDDDVELDSDLNMDSVASDQKYKFFLKPKGDKQDSKSIEEDLAEHWPEIQDETEDIETEIDLDMPDSAFEVEKPKKSKSENKSTQGKKIAAIIFIILLTAVAGILGWMLLEKKGGPDVVLQPFDVQSEKPKILIQEPLNGRYVVNKTMKKKIFVLQGAIKNFYPSDIKVSSVKVKGTLYNNEDVIIAESTVFAGNFLNNKQLETYSQAKMNAFYDFQFGENNVNLDLGVNQMIPFQVVFLQISGKFHKLEAKIESFSKNTQ